MLFHLTKKAQDFFGLKAKDLAPVAANDPPPLTAWYVNVLTMDRRKVLHVTEATTFYAVLIGGVTKAPALTLGPNVRQGLAEVMRRGGFTEAEVARATREDGPDRYAKTASRQVLGVMNEQAFAFGFTVPRGGIVAVDFPAASLRLAEHIVTPLTPTFYTPREAMEAALGRPRRPRSGDVRGT